MTLTDYDVDRFDVTKAPDVDIELPIEQRKPGGLGLHLIRRLVDSHRIRVFAGEPAEPHHVSEDADRGLAPVRRGAIAGRCECSRLISGRETAVVIAGRLDAPSRRRPRRSSTRSRGTVTLDCSRPGVHLQRRPRRLLKTQKRLLASGGELRLSGVNRHLQDIFVYSGFDQIFDIEAAPQ